MKLYTITLFAFLPFSVLSAQTNRNATTKSAIDTLKTFSGNLLSLISEGKEEYFVNTRKVSRSEFREFELKQNSIKQCKPCYLKSYDENDRLVAEGLQYMDCPTGVFIEYYPSGQIKRKGEYKGNTSGNWSTYQCNPVAVGTWFGYYENGNVYHIEKYVDGKLVESRE